MLVDTTVVYDVIKTRARWEYQSPTLGAALLSEPRIGDPGGFVRELGAWCARATFRDLDRFKREAEEADRALDNLLAEDAPPGR
jgi:hypothetical protein